LTLELQNEPIVFGRDNYARGDAGSKGNRGPAPVSVVQPPPQWRQGVTAAPARTAADRQTP